MFSSVVLPTESLCCYQNRQLTSTDTFGRR